MGRIGNYLGRMIFRSLENPSTPLMSLSAWAALFSEGSTAAGESINDNTALQILDVYAAVRVITEGIGTLPLLVYEVTDKGKKEATEHDIHYLLSVEPNPEMSAVSFWETTAFCCALTGNSYAQIVRNNAGRPAAIYPLHPHKTKAIRLPNNSLAYETTDGERPGSKRIVPAFDVLHMPLFGWDGLRGLSPIMMARESLGIARATEKFGGRFFANGSRPGGVLSTASNLSEKQQADVREQWRQQQGGENQGKTAVLWGDWKYEQVGISPEEAQFLQTRGFSRTQIAGLFRVPPHMIGDTTRLSNSNHEQESLQFVTDTLRPYLVRFEREVLRKLFPAVGRNSGRYVVQFDVSERLRGDFKTMNEGLAIGRQWGYLTANDCRASLGKNSIGEEGDVFLYPINMGNAEALLHPSALIPSTLAKQSSTEKSGTDRDVLPEPENDEERNAMAQYTSAYYRIFQSAVGRVAAREKRDSVILSAAFEPVLRSIQEHIEMQAEGQFNLPPGWNTNSDKQISEYLRSLEKRAQEWTAETVQKVATVELSKAIRSIVIQTYREAGALVALRGVGDAA